LGVYQIGPNKWSNRPPRAQTTRSRLPMPYVISDEMPPTENVDGVYYTSKRAFRATSRALNLIEVGNEKFTPFTRSTAKRETKAQRMAALKVAVEKYKAGHRPRRRGG
jgi:hypothetical protein